MNLPIAIDLQIEMLKAYDHRFDMLYIAPQPKKDKYT